MGRENLLERAVGGDATGFEEEGLGGELPDFREVVGDVQDGDSAAAKAVDDLRLGGCVESGEGFVEEEQARARREGACDGDALGFPAGEAIGFAVAEGLGVNEGEHFVDSLGALGGREVAQAEGDVFRDGAVREERGALGDEADVAASGRDGGAVAGVEEGLAVEDDAALLRGGESGEDAQKGAFSGGGWAEKDGPRSCGLGSCGLGCCGVGGDAEFDVEGELGVVVGDGGFKQVGLRWSFRHA